MLSKKVYLGQVSSSPDDKSLVIRQSIIEDNETGYYLDRSTDHQSWQRITELEADSASFLDLGLLLHLPYGYRLTAWNEYGQSDSATVQDALVEEEPGEITLNPTGVLTITYSYDPLYRLTRSVFAPWREPS